MNSFAKQIGKSASDAARAVAKQVVREPLEMGSTLKRQVMGGEASRVAETTSASGGGNETVPKLDEAALEADTQKKLADLKGEIAKLIVERNQKANEWKKATEEAMRSDEDSHDDKKTLVQPSTKKKRGFMGQMKGKQGTKEVGKGPSG